MSTGEFSNGVATLSVVAHEDRGKRLLLVQAVAEDRGMSADAPALNVAVVLDRSGSMSGANLDAAKQASAALIRSLRPSDRVAIVAYDNHVDVLAPLSPPSEGLARLVETLRPGGSTALYSGWVTGAKLLGFGGRVILLSDGLANVGPSDPSELAEHAQLSQSRFGVSTSTVGVGEGYDEALMAAMARAGKGAHYYAEDADAIISAFSSERFLLGAHSLLNATLSWEGGQVELGHILENEKKSWVATIEALPAKGLFTYVDAKTEERVSLEVAFPTQFGVHPIATAYLLVQEAADMMESPAGIRSQAEAVEKCHQTRQLLVRVGNHELAAEEPLVSLAEQLQKSIERLEHLAREFDQREALRVSKSRYQRAANLRNPGRAYSSDPAERYGINALRESARASIRSWEVDPAAFQLKPVEFWVRNRAVPVQLRGGLLLVGVLDPQDGFALSNLEQQVGLTVKPDGRSWTLEQILAALERFR